MPPVTSEVSTWMFGANYSKFVLDFLWFGHVCPTICCFLMVHHLVFTGHMDYDCNWSALLYVCITGNHSWKYTKKSKDSDMMVFYHLHVICGRCRYHMSCKEESTLIYRICVCKHIHTHVHTQQKQKGDYLWGEGYWWNGTGKRRDIKYVMIVMFSMQQVNKNCSEYVCK